MITQLQLLWEFPPPHQKSTVGDLPSLFRSDGQKSEPEMEHKWRHAEAIQYLSKLDLKPLFFATSSKIPRIIFFPVPQYVLVVRMIENVSANTCAWDEQTQKGQWSVVCTMVTVSYTHTLIPTQITIGLKWNTGLHCWRLHFYHRKDTFIKKWINDIWIFKLFLMFNVISTSLCNEEV